MSKVSKVTLFLCIQTIIIAEFLLYYCYYYYYYYYVHTEKNWKVTLHFLSVFSVVSTAHTDTDTVADNSCAEQLTV